MNASASITNLFSVDPVGDAGGVAGNSIKAAHVANWSNILAAPGDKNFSDRVADAGRMYFGRTDTTGADSSVSSGQHHGNFASMMRELNAPEIINQTYEDQK